MSTPRASCDTVRPARTYLLRGGRHGTAGDALHVLDDLGVARGGLLDHKLAHAANNGSHGRAVSAAGQREEEARSAAPPEQVMGG